MEYFVSSFNVFSYYGEHFFIFFLWQQDNFMARRLKMDIKLDTFGHIDTRVLAILGFKKVDFWTLPKCFYKCLGSVQKLFSAFRGLLLDIFLAQKIDK